jgi:hypothetical protein
MSQDDYYASHRARLDTIIGENVGFYSGLKQARDLWGREYPDQPVENFLIHLEDTYGIHMSARQKMSGVDTEYHITDEKKYMMFALKFGL